MRIEINQKMFFCYYWKKKANNCNKKWTKLKRYEKSVKGLSIEYIGNIFRKTSISYPLILTRSCEYHGVRNVSFSEKFADVLNEWSLMCNISGSKEQEISLRPVHQLMITQGKIKYAKTCCQIKNLVDAWIPKKNRLLPRKR